MEIKIAGTDEEIMECFEVLNELRPHLDSEGFVTLIRELQHSHNYELVYLKQTNVKSVMGIRTGLWLHTGRYLEIEDLITSSRERSNGYGAKLLHWAKEYAKAKSCNQLRLVSGVAREQAHEFYENNDMFYEAKYFSINL